MKKLNIMKEITKKEAIREFKEGGEIWVFTGDCGDNPIFDYELDADGDEMDGEENKLMHPLGLHYGDKIESLCYNKYHLP